MDGDQEAASATPPLPSALQSLLSDPRGVVRRRWKFMLAAFVLGVVGTVAYTLRKGPTYVAEAKVMVASQKLSEEFVRPTIEEDSLERINAMLGEALARPNLEKLIEERNLFPEARKDKSGDAVVLMRQNLSIDPARTLSGGAAMGSQRALILSVRYAAEDPNQAADVANDLARLLQSAGMRLRSQQARLTSEFMRRELESAQAALREETRRMAEFQQAHRGELPSELEPHLRRLERLQEQRNSLAMQIVEAEARVATLAATPSATSPAAARQQELRARLAQELSVNTETHPNVISLRRQIDLLEKQGGGEGGAGHSVAVEGSRREVEQLRQQLADVDRELGELDAKVAKIPARQEEFGAIEQRVTVLRENYLEFLRKLKEAELSESLELAQQGDRVAILEQALPPTRSAKSQIKLALMGMVASLGLAGFVALALEQLDPVITSASQLSPDVPVFGSIPRIS